MVTMCGFETKQNKLPFQVKAFHKKKKKKNGSTTEHILSNYNLWLKK